MADTMTNSSGGIVGKPVVKAKPTTAGTEDVSTSKTTTNPITGMFGLLRRKTTPTDKIIKAYTDHYEINDDVDKDTLKFLSIATYIECQIGDPYQVKLNGFTGADFNHCQPDNEAVGGYWYNRRGDNGSAMQFFA